MLSKAKQDSLEGFTFACEECGGGRYLQMLHQRRRAREKRAWRKEAEQ